MDNPDKRRDSINQFLITFDSFKTFGDKIELSLFAQRRREKQKARDEDARALASGEKTLEQLKRENGHFAFPNARVSMKGSKPLR